jgi:hypothetical protein
MRGAQVDAHVEEVNPPSRSGSPSGYSEPTIVEMFGLKKPFPTISSASARKKADLVSIVISRCPAAIRKPPSTTARRAPSRRSASMPPKNGVMYTSAV